MHVLLVPFYRVPENGLSCAKREGVQSGLMAVPLARSLANSARLGTRLHADMMSVLNFLRS